MVGKIIHKITTCGGQAAVIIPKILLQKLNWNIGDYVELDTNQRQHDAFGNPTLNCIKIVEVMKT